jgi:hypothetical protein
MRIRWRGLADTMTRGALPAWLAVAGVGGAVAVGLLLRWLFATDGGAAVRYAGTALQILGLLTVAVGLRQTRQLFPGRAGVGERIRAWYGQLASAFRKQQSITAHVVATGGAVTLSGKARVRLGAGADAPLERRLEVLQQNLDRLQNEFDDEIRELSAKIGRTEEGVRKEADERKRADDSITRVIEEATIGGLNLEVVGLFWLALGVLGQGVPDEIAKLIALVSGGRR